LNQTIDTSLFELVNPTLDCSLVDVEPIGNFSNTSASGN